MKLSIFSLLSVTTAVDTEFRLITNKDEWQTMSKPGWWDSKPMSARFNNLNKKAEQFITHIQMPQDNKNNAMNIHWKQMDTFANLLQDVLVDADRLRQSKCSSQRKRRSDSDEDYEDEDFIEDDVLARGKKPFRKSIRKDAKNYFRNIGRFVKFNVYDNGTPFCQRMGLRLVHTDTES